MKLSVQNYTLRSAFEEDFFGTLQGLKDMGLNYCEFAGLYGHEPAEVRAFMDEMGLQCSGAHISIDRAESDIEGVMAELKTLGTNLLIIPWLPKEGYENGWAPMRGRLKAIQEKVGPSGFTVLYHNHAFEFEPDAVEEGKSGMDVLMDDPELGFQVDLMWVQVGGKNPVDYVRKVAGRVPTVHLKDLAEGGGDIEAGKGVLDWDSIIAVCDEVGVEWGVVEMDQPPQAPLVSVRESVEFFRSRGIVE